MWLSLCFEETFLITSEEMNQGDFVTVKEAPWRPSLSPELPPPHSGHREVPQPPGLPESHHLLPTPAFPAAALAPDAPGNLGQKGGAGGSATGGPSGGLTVPSGCQPEIGAPRWSPPRPPPLPTLRALVAACTR